MYLNKILFVVFSSLHVFCFSQKSNVDSLRAKFNYNLKYKPLKDNNEYKVSEKYSLLVSDKRSFFINENSLKFDSAYAAQSNENTNTFDFRNVAPSKSTYLIIQKSDEIQFFENVARVVLSYNDAIISNWKLIDEHKIINSINCKKAEVNYKGRNWVAWYSTEIPVPFGPYKFTGLPGLIIKITDSNEIFDFELIESVSSRKLKGQVVSINKNRYVNPKVITKQELLKARENYRNNLRYELESSGTVFSDRPKVSNEVKDKYNLIEKDEQ